MEWIQCIACIWNMGDAKVQEDRLVFMVVQGHRSLVKCKNMESYLACNIGKSEAAARFHQWFSGRMRRQNMIN